MIQNCINPHCNRESTFFGAGALYAFQKDKTSHSRRHMEYFWLCASCAARLALYADSDGNVTVIPRSQTPGYEKGSLAGNVRLVFRSTGVSLPMNNREMAS